uniref:Glycosyltransferase n=1 Tax=Crocus sativus TaxID=82528 RepID=A0A0A8K931_CROSA|nr:glucosyltransferase 1 [Crocus sativus]
MNSVLVKARPHAVCLPFPGQGHINPMLKIARLLFWKGFTLTFVNTGYIHQRLVQSRGPTNLGGLPAFRFETIPEGIPENAIETMHIVPALCLSPAKSCLAQFQSLLTRVNSTREVPSVSCILSDGVISYTLDANEELGQNAVLFWTATACGFMAYVHTWRLIKRGIVPFKDNSSLTYADTRIDWLSGNKEVGLKDIPSFIRATRTEDIMLNFAVGERCRSKPEAAIILNCFESLEHDVIKATRSVAFAGVYSIGPLCVPEAEDNIAESLARTGANPWKEDTECLDWLDTKAPPNAVVKLQASLTVMTNHQLVEFAWGLASTRKEFLWLAHPDLVSADSTGLPNDFINRTANRAMLGTWCPQERVLAHPALGVYVTHSGWNSTLESVTGGVPMVCWPFFGDQTTNCRYACTEWGIGMEIDADVRREEVGEVMRELMGGEKGKEMKRRAVEWKESAFRATEPGGKSSLHIERLLKEVMLK